MHLVYVVHKPFKHNASIVSSITLQKILYISGAKQTGYFWQVLGICELLFCRKQSGPPQVKVAQATPSLFRCHTACVGTQKGEQQPFVCIQSAHFVRRNLILHYTVVAKYFGQIIEPVTGGKSQPQTIVLCQAISGVEAAHL